MNKLEKFKNNINITLPDPLTRENIDKILNNLYQELSDRYKNELSFSGLVENNIFILTAIKHSLPKQ